MGWGQPDEHLVNGESDVVTVGLGALCWYHESEQRGTYREVHFTPVTAAFHRSRGQWAETDDSPLLLRWRGRYAL